jgi:WD40 repeat protein
MKTRLPRTAVAYFLAVILTIILLFAALRYYASSYIPAAHIVYSNRNDTDHLPFAFDISPDDKHLACLDASQAVKIWRIPNVQLVDTYNLLKFADMNSVAWLANSRDIAVNNGQWIQNCIGALPNRAHSLTQQQIVMPFSTLAMTHKISPSGTLEVSGSFDGTLQIWNEATRRGMVLSRPTMDISGRNIQLCGFAISPDSSMVAAVYFPGPDSKYSKTGRTDLVLQMRMYDAITGELRRSWDWKEKYDYVTEGVDRIFLAVSQDDKYVVSATNSAYPGDLGDKIVWSVATGQKLSNLHVAGSCYQISFVNGTPYVALANSTDGIQICNYKTGKYLHSFHDGAQTQRFTVSRDGRYIASCYVSNNKQNSIINLWDLKNAL